MMKRAWSIALAALVFAWLPASRTRAADHADGPAAAADPTADITDVFAWTSPDAQKLNLVLGIGKNVAAATRFSDQVQYVFHTTSRASYGATAGTDLDIICTFDSSQRIQCWAGTDEYVTGDASQTTGIASRSGRLRVFAGQRDDAFFFNLTGFKETAAIVAGAAGALTFDPAGCPLLDPATAAVLVNQLQKGKGGVAPKDDFAKFNVLGLVATVDKAIVTKGGPIVSVWASTNRK